MNEINQLPAVTGVARIVDRGQEIYLFLAWIAKDDLVYQVLGAAPASHWNPHRLRFEAAAKMAVANDMTTEERLAGGESFKISKREPYQDPGR